MLMRTHKEMFCNDEIYKILVLFIIDSDLFVAMVFLCALNFRHCFDVVLFL